LDGGIQFAKTNSSGPSKLSVFTSDAGDICSKLCKVHTAVDIHPNPLTP